MTTRRPALRFVLLFAAGIILAVWISLSPAFLFSIVIIFILISIILFYFTKRQFIATLSLQCAIIILGALLQTLQQSNFHSRELEPRVADESVILFGSIDSEPMSRERKISFVVCVDSIVRHGKVEHDLRRVMTVVLFEKGTQDNGEIKFGKKIKLDGTLKSFPVQRNPGEFDYGKYLELNDIQGLVTVKGLRNVQICGEAAEGSSFQAWTYSIQHGLYRIIDSLHSPRHASFLKGIIFGYRADIPADVKQSFTDTGTIHILAVSGSNVAFVAFIFFSILGFFRLPRRAVGGVAILGLVAYMLITGASASVVRATIMAIVILCGTLFERKADIYNSISVAALVLLVWDTNTLFDVGFQLSFSAVLSIIYFYPRLELLIKKIPERFEEIKMVDAVLKLFAVSLAAQLGTVPFTAYYFGRVSIISLIANIPVVPISGLNTFIGFAEVLFFFVSPWIASLYAAANDFLVWFLLGFVKQAASIPFAYLEAWHFSAMVIIVYYIMLIGLFNLSIPRVRTWMLILLLSLGNYILFADVWFHTNPICTVTVIDVGQGDAILLECPNEKRILIDTGPWSMHFDAGERTIVPFLKRKGITTLDYLLITHPHSDHIGGAKSVLRSIRVDTLVMTSNNSDNRQVKEVLEAAQQKNIGLKTAIAGSQIQIDLNARMYILYPKFNQPEERNLNNSSVVIKVIFNGASMLLVGDAETMVEQKLISKYAKFLSSDVLKVGHHGSISSTSEQFLKIVHPRIALISVGNNNKFRHPSPFTLSRLKANSIDIERTDKFGAIVLESDGNRWIKIEWKKKQ